MNIDFSPLIDDLPLAYRYRPAVGQPIGLVILMHGVGSNEDSLLGLGSFIPNNLSVVSVRSPLTMAPGAYSAFSVSFTGNGPKIDTAAAEASRQRLLRFIPELQLRYGVTSDQTLIAGFSQGGIMSASLALTAPKCVRGFAILSGRILPEIEPLIARAEDLQHLSALVIHGKNDDRLPYFWAEKSTELLQTHGIPSHLLNYGIGHEITHEVATDFASWVRNILL
ncbi:alpha/beta hydrolase [Aeromonas hydrophila]|uniref:alpha/beta hydrolase n=1 Tax=Aeromonas hydrophila TaxID=644 RepID=UPI003EC7CBBF